MKNTAPNHLPVKNFGELFLLVIHEGEILKEFKVRIQKKLQVPDEEFSKWKFAFFYLGRPEYLQDSDFLSSRFQVLSLSLSHTHTCACMGHLIWVVCFVSFLFLFSQCFQRIDVYGKWEQDLGLEHPDNAPKRSYAANQREMVSLSLVPPPEGCSNNGNEAFQSILGEKDDNEREIGHDAKLAQSWRRSSCAEVAAAKKRADDAEQMALEAIQKLKETEERLESLEQHVQT
ncbi:uncharacterized protein LOC132271216 isoform X1 [Cornus florida]|uniref:uncharacterized protein LOC132271216 isoform X1 n=1 Tax=Cornus florida TaxID=4283 RepID=UPI00289D6291|nr:uncharacterized protein LOC132271216 isoform X1 [Cornus florida]XP_059628514.1 uncharacterized protein LOC132271216 isoform X1 [Cornus florida]XP_059628515.1 uncharacterized protein LOC132271216 isoform X1 [Cornus florida]